MHELSYEILSDTVILADAVSWRHSCNNSSISAADDYYEASESVEDENLILHKANSTLNEVSLKVNSAINNFLSRINSVVEFFKNLRTDEMNNASSALINVLYRTRLMTSLASLISLSAVLNEFTEIIDWVAGGSFAQLFYNKLKIQINDLLTSILKLPKVEYLFGCCPTEIQLIQGYISSSNESISYSFLHLLNVESPTSSTSSSRKTHSDIN
jgi:hypothetical protein